MQAQDRCHRIGQTREVHIYRLVSEKTIEENILIKSDQKRHLDHLAIQSGGFNTEFLQKFNPQDILNLQGDPGLAKAPSDTLFCSPHVMCSHRQDTVQFYCCLCLIVRLNGHHIGKGRYLPTHW